jgi:prephenate dehydrogenase
VPSYTCRTCGRVVDADEPLERLPFAERRCPRCGADLAPDHAAVTADRKAAVHDAREAAAVGQLPSRIAFLGLGLIGGSIALALREAGVQTRLAAWSPSGRGPAAGRRRGLVDEAAQTAAAALDGADLVILAGPPLSVLTTIDDLGGPLRASLAEGASITDVASTKRRVIDAASRHGLPFVGGHPMAGRETTGVEAATAELFVRRPWVVVPSGSARSIDLERVEALARAVGARPMHMTAEDHDAAVAAISHLPLVLAASLAESVAASTDGAPTWPAARQLAATGWSDMTRLAKGDPAMGAGILATNADAVAARLRSVRAAIDAWLEALDGAQSGDSVPALERRLEAAREALTREAGQ